MGDGFGGRPPKTKAGRHLHDQLMRAATAPGAHYAEARSAQSRDDFIQKIGLAAKETREALHWLRALRHARTVDCDPRELIGEADELVAILFSSLRTARSSRREKAKNGDGE